MSKLLSSLTLFARTHWHIAHNQCSIQKTQISVYSIRWLIMAQYIQSGKYVQPSYVRAPAPAKVAVRRHHPFELVAIKDAVRQDDITRVKNERKGGLDSAFGGLDIYTGSADTIRPPTRTRLNRNNTDFPLKLFEYFRGLPEES